MVTFEPFGPYDIPISKLSTSRLIAEDLSTFWEQHKDMGSGVGCYIFSIKTGRAVVPFYVGMTLSTFESECFTDHKLKHYHRVIGRYTRGKPVMSFVVHPSQRGRDNSKAIKELENFLIQAGMVVNPALRNIRGRTEPQWAIKGVIRSGPGPRREEAKAFAKMMGIDV